MYAPSNEQSRVNMPLSTCILPKHRRRGVKRLLCCRAMFWTVITILLFFQAPSVAQVPLPPPPSREGDNASLKPAQQGGKWGYIDKDGKVLISFQYEFAGQFTNGHACVEFGWLRAPATTEALRRQA